MQTRTPKPRAPPVPMGTATVSRLISPSGTGVTGVGTPSKTCRDFSNPSLTARECAAKAQAASEMAEME